MKLIIPGVLPSVNHQYRNARVGNRTIRVLTAEAETWKQEIIVHSYNWRRRSHWKTQKAGTMVIVNLWYFFPNWRKRDTHNTLKLLLDCFEDALIYENDQFALPRVMDLRVDKQNPRTEIEFEIMG